MLAEIRANGPGRPDCREIRRYYTNKSPEGRQREDSSEKQTPGFSPPNPRAEAMLPEASDGLPRLWAARSGKPYEVSLAATLYE